MTRPVANAGPNRRLFLRGAAGAALALPWLEYSSPRARAAEPPSRLIITSGGFSLGAERGDLPELLNPGAPGDTFDLPDELSPLADLRDRFNVISGLAIPGEDANGVVPPAGRHSHDDGFHYHYNPLLAGYKQRGDPRDATVTGPSPDEVAADAWAGRTLFRTVTWRAQPEFYYFDQVAAYAHLSYRQIGGVVRPVVPQTSPQQAWLQLTGGFLPSDPGLAESRLRDLARRRSVLDHVDRRADGLMTRLGEADRQRLEQHYQQVRDLELRLADPAVADNGACRAPLDPGPDPDAQPGGYSDEDTRARTFNELLRFALACDLVRSGSLMYTFWKSYIGTAAIAGYDWTLHDVLHSGTNEQLRPMVRWHVDLWADLVRRLRDTPEGEGSLLDHTSIVFVPEGGYGFGPDGRVTTSHTCERMVLLTAGGAGGMTGGRHLVAPTGFTHPVNVLIASMQAAGIDVDTHGEVTGALPGLLPG